MAAAEITCKWIANHAVAPKSAVAEPACRQYRVVRWFLLPEAGLRRRCFPPTTFVILTNRKWQLYRLQGTRTNLFGKTPSNTTGSAGNELWGSMDDADKSSAPSIPGPGCTPRQASCYGRCFARSGPPMIPAVLQSTSTGDHLPTTFRGTFLAEVYAFPVHLGRRYALYGPATGFAREGGLQNWILSDNPLRPSGHAAGCGTAAREAKTGE